MDPVALVVVIGLLTLVVLLVGEPLRRGRAEAADERERRDVEGLDAAKAAKYREIRELELDFRTGKLEEDEYRRQDRDRRAEAVVILRELDRLGAGEEPVSLRRSRRRRREREGAVA